MPTANWEKWLDIDYKDLSIDQWAWEFVRRNPDYIQEYKKFKPQETIANVGDARHWGLKRGYIPPTTDSHPRIEFYRSYGDLLPDGHPVPPGKVAISFDLSMPNKPQIEYATKLLKECRKAPKFVNRCVNGELLDEISVPQTNIQRDNLPYYLATWDARKSNFSNAKIAKAVYPHAFKTDPPNAKQRIQTFYDTAKKFILDKQYANLLIRP